MKKVGFFGGTFDPIHFGHLNLAINILEKHQLDHLFFSPAKFSPTKEENLPSSPDGARMEMTRLAIEEIPVFSLLDLEVNREGASYTIDTIQELIALHPGVQMHLILGEDNLKELMLWKEIEALLTIAPPLTGTRPRAKLPTLPSFLKEAVDQGRTDIPSMEISSTDLRKRLKEQKYCGHLIPAKVLDYIHTHGLYL